MRVYWHSSFFCTHSGQPHLLKMLSFHCVNFPPLYHKSGAHRCVDVRPVIFSREVFRSTLLIDGSACVSAVTATHPESGTVLPPAVLSVFDTVLAILGFFCFHTKLKIVLSRSLKLCLRILMGLHCICRMLLAG